VGAGELDPSPTAAMARTFGADRADPVLRYLVGRQLVNHGRYEEALELIPRAPTGLDPRVHAECSRLRAVALFHLGRLEESARAFGALSADPRRPRGARDAAADWIDRIRRTRDIR